MIVYLQTRYKATRIKTRNLGQIKATRTGLYVQHGRQWLCYDGARITARQE